MAPFVRCAASMRLGADPGLDPVFDRPHLVEAVSSGPPWQWFIPGTM